MQGRSHKYLASHLVDKYMTSLPKRHVRAFLIGCIQPDRNITTYLKGSIRSTWLRGHNWNNAKRFMARICARLEKKSPCGILDYYALGKLIHYTADSFTYAHNDHFQDNLRRHKEYEKLLHQYFVRYLPSHKPSRVCCTDSLMNQLRTIHREYMTKPTGVYNDSKYALNACYLVMTRLVGAIETNGNKILSHHA